MKTREKKQEEEVTVSQGGDSACKGAFTDQGRTRGITKDFMNQRGGQQDGSVGEGTCQQPGDLGLLPEAHVLERTDPTGVL